MPSGLSCRTLQVSYKFSGARNSGGSGGKACLGAISLLPRGRMLACKSAERVVRSERVVILVGESLSRGVSEGWGVCSDFENSCED